MYNVACSGSRANTVQQHTASNPSAIVSGAGTPSANGTYTRTGTNDGKPFYNKAGTNPAVSSVAWSIAATAWQILDTDGTNLYSNDGEDVALPWLSAHWISENGDPPEPTVTSS